jgi:hypothetical protein
LLDLKSTEEETRGEQFKEGEVYLEEPDLYGGKADWKMKLGSYRH